MLEDVFSRAYEMWKRHAGALAIAGIVAWSIPIILAAMVGVISAAFGIKNPENLPIWATATTMVAGIALMNGFAVGANYAVRRGRILIQDILHMGAEKSLDAATAFLFASFPAITGMLLGMLVVVMLGDSWGWLASILAVSGALGTVLVSLLPYLATEHGWQGAMDRAIRLGKMFYITLFLLNVFFALIYITLLALLPNPEWGATITFLIDALFLMHIRHQTFFEVLDSVQDRE